MQLVEFTNHQGATLRGLLSTAASTDVVVCIHGFERTTIEHKFKVLEERLRGAKNIFRFDFSGLGMSDGSFEEVTIARSAAEVHAAIQALEQLITVDRVHFVTHSLGGAIVAEYLLQYQETQLGQSVMLAPAFNQQAIFRLWFVQRQYPDKAITWENYQALLDEELFQQSVSAAVPMKQHMVGVDYFVENKTKDYNDVVLAAAWFQQFMVVHGDQDLKVPIASNRFDPTLVVHGGDHDLERLRMHEQWIDPVTQWLLG